MTSVQISPLHPPGGGPETISKQPQKIDMSLDMHTAQTQSTCNKGSAFRVFNRSWDFCNRYVNEDKTTTADTVAVPLLVWDIIKDC